jgi:hypothetical protein
MRGLPWVAESCSSEATLVESVHFYISIGTGSEDVKPLSGELVYLKVNCSAFISWIVEFFNDPQASDSLYSCGKISRQREELTFTHSSTRTEKYGHTRTNAHHLEGLE